MRRLFITIVIILSLGAAKSQETFLLKDLYIPQVLDENPGYSIPYRFHIGFPCLSRVNVGFSMPVNYGQAMNIETSILEKIKNNNRLSVWGQEDLIAFGFRINHQHYFWFSSSLKVDAQVNAKRDIFNFLINGNAPYEGKTLNFLDNDAVNGVAYAEFGIGFNREVNRKISWGVKAKYLLGVAAAYSRQADLKLYTEKDFDMLRLDYSADAIIAFGPGESQEIEHMVDTVLNSLQNHGVAIDLGFRWKINKVFEIDLSVLDLGYIHWKHCYNYKVQENYYSFDGVWVPNDSLGDFYDSVWNDIKSDFADSTTYIGDQRKMITTKINVGGYIWASKNDRFGLNFQGRIVNGKFIPQGSVSYHRNCGTHFDFTIGNTFKANSLLNPGIGFSVKFGVFNLYALLDYTNHFYVDKIKNCNVVFGINFLSGRAYSVRGPKPSPRTSFK